MLIKIWPVSLKMLDLFDVGFANTFGAIRNWGRWSDIVAVRLQNILSIRVLVWPVSQVGWNI